MPEKVAERLSADTQILKQVLDELQLLIQHVLNRGSERIIQHIDISTGKTLDKSLVNLAHYLALRELDLRPLQEKLAKVGLSSLGRAEPHVLANLLTVESLLCRVVAKPETVITSLPYPEFTEGYEILERHTNTCLGESRQQRITRVMVTLPSEAATDYDLVYKLVKEGMEIARINCAHDEVIIWEQMIKHVKQASKELSTPCRILMDLAGHKIRTGPISSDQQPLNIKVRKDIDGHALKAILFKILPYGQRQQPTSNPIQHEHILSVPLECYNQLIQGDRFSLVDAMGKKRHIEINFSNTGEVFGECYKSLQLTTQTEIVWQRSSDMSYRDLQSFYFVNYEPSVEKIHLHAGDELILHKNPEPGHAARYLENGELLSPPQINCTLPEVIDALEPGASVWFDDGKIGTTVVRKSVDSVLLRVTKTGPKGAKLAADKGLNFPETALNLPPLTVKDRQDLDFICKHADMIGFSFVETAEDMCALIQELQLRQAGKLPIIAKIETARAVKNLPDILFAGLLEQPLAVMIARGDLTVELGSVRMAEIQEEMLWLCEAAHVPVIWATQVLESIVKHGVRSRPEFTDAAMGVRAECVMLNKGPYILDAVRSLNQVLTCMQQHQRKKISRLRALHW